MAQTGPMRALQRAIDHCGTQAELARRVAEFKKNPKIKQAHIWNWLNRDQGPHFWAGISVVNASENDARTALTSDHKTFPRLNLGAQYRTELFSISETKSVALELNWRFYYEFNAPQPIKDAELDLTSYFKATVLFPGNIFIEYTDGKLPTDVEGGSTVAAGWRYNF